MKKILLILLFITSLFSKNINNQIPLVQITNQKYCVSLKDTDKQYQQCVDTKDEINEAKQKLIVQYVKDLYSPLKNFNLNFDDVMILNIGFIFFVIIIFLIGITSNNLLPIIAMLFTPFIVFNLRVLMFSNYNTYIKC